MADRSFGRLGAEGNVQRPRLRWVRGRPPPAPEATNELRADVRRLTAKAHERTQRLDASVSPPFSGPLPLSRRCCQTFSSLVGHIAK